MFTHRRFLFPGGERESLVSAIE